jgi:hypothetical protein
MTWLTRLYRWLMRSPWQPCPLRRETCCPGCRHVLGPDAHGAGHLSSYWRCPQCTTLWVVPDTRTVARTPQEESP